MLQLPEPEHWYIKVTFTGQANRPTSRCGYAVEGLIGGCVNRAHTLQGEHIVDGDQYAYRIVYNGTSEVDFGGPGWSPNPFILPGGGWR